MNDFPAHLVVNQPILRNSPLKSVICQMTFQEVLGLGPTDVRPLQKAFASRYPIVNREEGVELNLGEGGLRPTGEVRRTFKFTDPDDLWTVTLSPDSLALETSAYLDFQDFAQRWHQVCGEVTRALEITQQERLGLRYINHLDTDQENRLSKLVRPELISLVESDNARTNNLVRSFQEALFSQEDGFITFRHGLTDTGENSSYVLDFDYFTAGRTAFDLEEQEKTLISFNHGIFDLFKWAVHREAFAKFEPEERNDD